MYTHLIWDFNGTLYDDVDASIRSANRLLTSHGLSPIEGKARYRDTFCFPVQEYYRKLGFDFERMSFESLAPEWIAYYMEESRTSPLFPDIPEALERVKRRGLCQIVLSATERGMLNGQLEMLGIRSYFDELLGLDDIHAASKTEVGIRWRLAHPEAKAVLIGDTHHDADTAREMGVDCVLLTVGHQSRRVLESCPCLFVADSATEALDRLLSDSF